MHIFDRKAKDNQNGSALVGVLCIMCVFSAIALSMLFAAYQVLHDSQQIMTKEQCHILAKTFSREMDKEITREDDSAGIRSYIKNAMLEKDGQGWQYFDEEKEGHSKKEVIKYLDADLGAETEKKTGTTKVGLYWKYSGNTESASYEDRILVVEVRTSLRGEQYQVVNQYELRSGSVEAGVWVWDNMDKPQSGGES